MSTFLGRPPASIKRWIEEHYTPPAKEQTVFWVDGVEQEPVMIEGILYKQWFIDHGYFSQDKQTWLKQITKAEIGSKVTSIGELSFFDCIILISVSIPSSVISIDNYAFINCYNLATVYVDSESEKERVKSLYAWPATVQFEVKA